MILITDFMVYGEVRAVLGVSKYELLDDTLSLPVYARALQAKLRGIQGTFGAYTGSLLDIYDALSISSTTTAEDDALLEDIKQLAVYVVAEACLPGLSMFALKSTSDGKTTGTRFSSEATFKDVAAAIHSAVTALTAKLAEALGSEPYTAAPQFLKRVAPETDRVTG